MITLEYLITTIVAASGTMMGIILFYIAKEEVKPGKPYFALIRTIAAAVLILALAPNLPGAIAAAAAAIALYHLDIKRELMTYNKYLLGLSYLMLGIALWASSPDKLLIAGTLVFIYGLPTGTSACEKIGRWKPALISLIMPLAAIILMAIVTP